jgi:hypothetical protein
MKYVLCALMALGLAGCAGPERTVRQQDLDAWVGAPVEALDTHSIFITVQMVRTMTSGGIEIRNYSTSVGETVCSEGGGAYVSGSWVNGSSFSSCTSMRSGCNYIFYIRSGRVLELAPTGSLCYTNDKARPEARYSRMAAPS